MPDKDKLDAQPVASRDWLKIAALVERYAADYEMFVGDEAGREGYYTPNDHERALILDAINGLFADDEFMAAFDAAEVAP